ncbi:signal peptide peptidase SppA [Candidatus Woesearchaeota archaeon ex4484_78]|nr:MAG: signal peptide peptidase SppA [Candidatus Woesearchaeota archaeon ex4484_78]
MAKKRKKPLENKPLKKINTWNIIKTSFKIISAGFSILLTIFFIIFFIGILSMFITPETIKEGNIAVIGIKGLITTGDNSPLSSIGTKSQDIVDLIEKANKENKIKAILLDIDSGGGAPVASYEIADAVKKSNKTVIAVIREIGASGAYWIASAADKIFANKMSITGSIGVRASKIEIAGLMKDYNITYRRLVAGKYKDIGTPFKEMTPKEQEMYQKLIDELHEIFIKAVAENRNMPEEKVKELANGFVFLGIDAKKLGLIDEIGGKKEALDYLKKELKLEKAKPVEYKKPKTFIRA